MLSLRSLAFILASAIRRERALSCAALHRLPDRISGRRMATISGRNMDTKMAAAFMSVSYEEVTPSRRSDGTSRPCPDQRYNQRRLRTPTCTSVIYRTTFPTDLKRWPEMPRPSLYIYLYFRKRVELIGASCAFIWRAVSLFLCFI